MNQILSKKTQGIILCGAILALGMSMPSCPGQQAMQQQLDNMTTTHAELQKKVMSQETQIRTLSQKVEQAEQLLGQMAGTIKAEEGAIQQLATTLKDMQAHQSAKAAPAKGAAKATKKKGR